MNDPRMFLPLSAQQFQILLALTDADRHGYGIILDIEERTRGQVRLGTGTLYTAIAGMLDGDLIAEARNRSGEDPRRKYYRLTQLGRSVLQAETHRLEALVREARRKGIRATARPAQATLSRSK
jgi:DNA-binding PadR family transcriptional regulator